MLSDGLVLVLFDVFEERLIVLNAFFDGIDLMLELFGDLSVFENDGDFGIFEVRFECGTNGAGDFGDSAVGGLVDRIQ